MWNDRDCNEKNFFLCERPMSVGKFNNTLKHASIVENGYNQRPEGNSDRNINHLSRQFWHDIIVCAQAKIFPNVFYSKIGFFENDWSKLSWLMMRILSARAIKHLIIHFQSPWKNLGQWIAIRQLCWRVIIREYPFGVPVSRVIIQTRPIVSL